MFIDEVQELSADVCLNVHAVGRVEPNYISLPVLALRQGGHDEKLM